MTRKKLPAMVEDLEAVTHHRNRTRATKEASGEQRVVKEYTDNRNGMKDFVPTASQKELANKIREHTIVFINSEAGTGKSSAVLHYFCKEYLLDPSKQIVVIRTPIEVGGDKIGFLPNSESEKLAVHFSSARILLEQFLGKNRVEADFEKRIFFKAPNFMLDRKSVV